MLTYHVNTFSYAQSWSVCNYRFFVFVRLRLSVPTLVHLFFPCFVALIWPCPRILSDSYSVLYVLSVSICRAVVLVPSLGTDRPRGPPTRPMLLDGIKLTSRIQTEVDPLVENRVHATRRYLSIIFHIIWELGHSNSELRRNIPEIWLGCLIFILFAYVRNTIHLTAVHKWCKTNGLFVHSLTIY